MTVSSLCAFFYGTLMHPRILTRVIGNDGDHLQLCPAILLDYTRHQIKHADYPGIVPYSKSHVLFDRDLDSEEKSVRGTLVMGLSSADIQLLDIFEGDEYTRERVFVHPLSPLIALSEASSSIEQSIVPAAPPPLPAPDAFATSIGADTYIWINLPRLYPMLWSFEEFVQNNAWKWVGRGADGNKDYVAVDRRRAMNERIVVEERDIELERAV